MVLGGSWRGQPLGSKEKLVAPVVARLDPLERAMDTAELTVRACPLAELAQTAALVQRVMAEAYELRVPLQTEARSGYNWGQMTPISQP